MSHSLDAFTDGPKNVRPELQFAGKDDIMGKPIALHETNLITRSAVEIRQSKIQPACVR
jgi:hypothetical protein